jgi:hypothetical protein
MAAPTTTARPAAAGAVRRAGAPGVAPRVRTMAVPQRRPLHGLPPALVGRAVSRARRAPPTTAAAAAPSSTPPPATPDVPALRSAVLRAAANTDRGAAADRDARVSVLAAVAALEAASPARDAALDAPGLSGEWGLVYAGPGDAAEAAAADTRAYEKRTGGLNGPVIAALAPLGRWAVKGAGTTQAIDAENGIVHNIAAFTLLGGLRGELDVAGTVAPAPPGEVSPAVEALGCGRARTDVAFTDLTLRLGAFKPSGFIETTFLDGELRVSRGDKGSVFVAAKRKTGGKK